MDWSWGSADENELIQLPEKGRSEKGKNSIESSEIAKRWATYQAKAQNHAAPEADVVECLPPTHKARALQHDYRKLHHLTDEAVAAYLLADAAHDDLVAHGADEEGDGSRAGLPYVWPAGAVDMASQEAVYGHVPLAGELHPVGTIPPVAVEVAVRKVRYLGEGAKHVLEDDEEYKQEGKHEGEEQPRDGLGHD